MRNLGRAISISILTSFALAVRVSHLFFASVIWVVMILLAYAGRYRPEGAPAEAVSGARHGAGA